MDIIKLLEACGIMRLVYADEVREVVLQSRNLCHIQMISALDTRSAVYMATGICAQNQEPVAVLVASSSSRSAFSGMTEAYYRKLPVILITIGMEVDYTVELKDVVMSHVTLPECATQEQWKMALMSELPMHIELNHPLMDSASIQCKGLMKALEACLEEKHYILLGQDINCDTSAFGCKVVRNGISGCQDGALSNTLGASLVQRHQRYIGVVSESEFLHDMNALGNINVNDSLVYFVICDQNNEMICDYAKSLGFNTSSIAAGEITKEDIKKVFDNKKKSLVIVYGE